MIFFRTNDVIDYWYYDVLSDPREVLIPVILTTGGVAIVTIMRTVKT